MDSEVLTDSLILAGIFCDIVGALILASTLWISRREAGEVSSTGLRSGGAHFNYLLRNRKFLWPGASLVILGFVLQFLGYILSI